MATQTATLKNLTYEGRNKANHKEKEDEMSQQVSMNQRSPIVTSATKSDRKVGTTKIYCSKGGNLEDNKKSLNTEDYENVETSPTYKKKNTLKYPQGNSDFSMRRQ